MSPRHSSRAKSHDFMESMAGKRTAGKWLELMVRYGHDLLDQLLILDVIL